MLLLRVDMPGLRFEDLDLRFDHHTGRLHFQPEAVDDLILWNDLYTQADLDELHEDLLYPHTSAHNGMYDVLTLCYAQWRARGGTSNGAMEASLSAATPIHLTPLAPRRQSLLHTLSLALQSWLGLLDTYQDFEPA